jgi:SAM-dependent methyltransferase
MNVQTSIPAPINLAAIKSRQQAAWDSGDYAVIGTTLQIVGEMLCEAVDLRSNQRVLDVAAGNGNATLAAARRFADVVSTDYVGSLLERAEANRLAVIFQEADAEDLPFADASFDVVLSTFGVMFTPNQEQVASELIRVCRPGGKIGLANWTPEGFIGKLVQDHRQICAAGHGREVANAVGYQGSSRYPFWLADEGGCEEQRFRFPLQVAKALGRNFPRLLWPGLEGIRWDRSEGTGRA